jgi:hypothetical protein
LARRLTSGAAPAGAEAAGRAACGGWAAWRGCARRRPVGCGACSRDACSARRRGRLLRRRGGPVLRGGFGAARAAVFLVLAASGSSEALPRSGVVMGAPRICGGGLRLPGWRPRIWWWRLRPGGGACLGVADRGIPRPAWCRLRQRGRARSGGAPLGVLRCLVGGGWYPAGTGSCWQGFTGRNPFSGLCRIWRRRRPRTSCSSLEASLLCAAPPCSPRPWLRRETSDPRDRAMKAISRLLPPWRHRLGAGYNLETGGWRHLRRRWMAASSPLVDGGIFAAWFAEAAVFGGADFCLATMMAPSGARVAARASVVGSSRHVRGALPWIAWLL